MQTQALLGTSAFALGVIALGLALAKSGQRRRPAAVLLPIAIILGTLRWVAAYPPSIDLLLTVASLLVAVAAVWDLLRK